MIESYAAVAEMQAGELHIGTRVRAGMVAAFKEFDDGPVIVTVERGRPKTLRDVKANRYLWKLLTAIAVASESTKEIVHDDMCDRFLRTEVLYIHPDTGEISEREFVRGTKHLSAKEFATFLDQIKAWALDALGLAFEDLEEAA